MNENSKNVIKMDIIQQHIDTLDVVMTGNSIFLCFLPFSVCQLLHVAISVHVITVVLMSVVSGHNV